MDKHDGQVNALTCRSLLVSVVIHAPTFRKYDKVVTEKVDEIYSSTESGRFNKMLVNKTFMQLYTKAAGAIRTYIYAHTLPWLDSGQRIIGTEQFMTFASRLGKLKDEFNHAVNEFLAIYETDVINEARQRMGNMFNPAAYCSAAKVRQMFSIEVSFSPVPEEGDFRAMLPKDVIEDLTGQFKERIDDWGKRSVGTLINRMLERISNAEQSICKYSDASRLRNNMFDKIVDIAYIAKDLNINKHQVIDDATYYVISKMKDIDVDRIRADMDYRAKVLNTLRTTVLFLKDLNQGRNQLEDQREDFCDE